MALKDMWEDIRRRHDHDGENVRGKAFVEATRVLCLCRVAAVSPSVRAHFECVASALCCMCTCARLFSEACDTSKPCTFERQSTSAVFFMFTNVFRLEVF